MQQEPAPPTPSPRTPPLWATLLGCAHGSVLGLFFLWLVVSAVLAPFSGILEPWIEASDVSPDGRYTVHREGRSNFMDLEARVTIEVTGDRSTRAELLPWSGSLPHGLEWTSPREFTIVLGLHGGKRPPIHGSWRDVKYTVDAE